jgi:hypothetical protein
MWLIAETTNGNRMEWWNDGKCVVSFRTDAPLDKLEELKKMLADCGMTGPRWEFAK